MTEATLDQDLLAKDLQEKIDREKITLQEAARRIGCGAATVSRLLKGAEADNYPDTSTLLKTVSWLGHSITQYDRSHKPQVSSIRQVEVHLRALPGLNQRDREALVAMVRAAHDAAIGLRRPKR